MKAKYFLDTTCLYFLVNSNQKMTELFNTQFAGKVELNTPSKAEALCGYSYIGAMKKLRLMKGLITSCLIHPIDEATSDLAIDIWVDAKKKGLVDKGIPVDYYIAATCLLYNLTLVTFNVKHFSFIKNLDLIALDYNYYISK